MGSLENCKKNAKVAELEDALDLGCDHALFLIHYYTSYYIVIHRIRRIIVLAHFGPFWVVLA